MLFSVIIRHAGKTVWLARVEAEDREGAKREALALLARGGGIYAGRRRLPLGASYDVEVEPVERRP